MLSSRSTRRAAFTFPWTSPYRCICSGKRTRKPGPCGGSVFSSTGLPHVGQSCRWIVEFASPLTPSFVNRAQAVEMPWPRTGVVVSIGSTLRSVCWTKSSGYLCINMLWQQSWFLEGPVVVGTQRRSRVVRAFAVTFGLTLDLHETKWWVRLLALSKGFTTSCSWTIASHHVNRSATC